MIFIGHVTECLVFHRKKSEYEMLGDPDSVHKIFLELSRRIGKLSGRRSICERNGSILAKPTLRAIVRDKERKEVLSSKTRGDSIGAQLI